MIFRLVEEKIEKPFVKKDAGDVEYNNSVFNNSTMCESIEDVNKELLDDCAEYIRNNDRSIWIEDAYTTNEGFAFVVDGDWKHDHLRLDHLIEKFFVDTEYVIFIHEVTTESDGSDNYKAIHYIRIEDISNEIEDDIDFSGTVGTDHFEGLVSDEDLEKIETFLDGCDAEIYYNHNSNTYLVKDTSADFGPYTLSELLEDITYTLSQWDEIDSEE